MNEARVKHIRPGAPSSAPVVPGACHRNDELSQDPPVPSPRKVPQVLRSVVALLVQGMTDVISQSSSHKLEVVAVEPKFMSPTHCSGMDSHTAEERHLVWLHKTYAYYIIYSL